MNFFNKLQGFLEKFIGPLAERLNRSDIIGGLSSGMMQTLPITLGISVFAILVNFPIRPWQTFLINTGLYAVIQEMVSATMSREPVQCKELSRRFCSDRHEQHRTGILCHAHEDLRQILEFQLLIYKHGYKEGICHADGSRLRGGEVTGVHTAQQNHRNHERRECRI